MERFTFCIAVTEDVEYSILRGFTIETYTIAGDAAKGQLSLLETINIQSLVLSFLLSI